MKAKVILLCILGVMSFMTGNAQTSSGNALPRSHKADTLTIDSLFTAIFPINLYDARKSHILSLFKTPFHENITELTDIRVHTFTQGKNVMRLNYMLNDQGYVLDYLCLHDDVMRLGMGFRIGMSRDVFNKIVRINTTQDIVVIFNDYQTVRCIFFFKENKLIHIIISPEQYGRSVWWSEILTDIYGVNQGL